MRAEIVGMAWYQAEDYNRLRALFLDGKKLPRKFDDWLIRAQAVHDRMTQRGHMVFKAIIEPDAFSVWCQQRGQLMDAQARMEYASEIARQYSMKKSE